MTPENPEAPKQQVAAAVACDDLLAPQWADAWCDAKVAKARWAKTARKPKRAARLPNEKGQR